jgi:hypothetical protein
VPFEKVKIDIEQGIVLEESKAEVIDSGNLYLPDYLYCFPLLEPEESRLDCLKILKVEVERDIAVLLMPPVVITARLSATSVDKYQHQLDERDADDEGILYLNESRAFRLLGDNDDFYYYQQGWEAQINQVIDD